MPEDSLLAKVIDDHDVAFGKVGVQNSCHYRLIVWQELLSFAAILLARILFLNDFHERTKVDIGKLG